MDPFYEYLNLAGLDPLKIDRMKRDRVSFVFNIDFNYILFILISPYGELGRWLTLGLPFSKRGL